MDVVELPRISGADFSVTSTIEVDTPTAARCGKMEAEVTSEKMEWGQVEIRLTPGWLEDVDVTARAAS
jgi:hypothetical protein